MGFMIGRIIVKTLLDMDPADLDDPVAVNEAIKNIKNFDTHIVCKPWYFGGSARRQRAEQLGLQRRS